MYKMTCRTLGPVATNCYTVINEETNEAILIDVTGKADSLLAAVREANAKVTEKIFGEKDVTILNVWGTYCGPCKKEMPELAKLEEELPDNVQIIGIVLDVLEGDEGMIEVAREICEDTNVTYTNIVVNDSMYDMLADIEAIPTTFILDKEGKSICEPIVGADVDSYKNAAMEYLDKVKE